MLLDKMHGEVVFFAQLFILSLVYIFFPWPIKPVIDLSWYPILFSLLSLAFACEVASRQARQAKLQKRLKDEKERQIAAGSNLQKAG
jgi:uncharacterized membrane protein